MTLDQEDLNKISGLIKNNIETSPFLTNKFNRIDERLDKLDNKLNRLEDKVDTLAEENKQDHEYFAQRLNEGFNHISKQLVQILNHEQRN